MIICMLSGFASFAQSGGKSTNIQTISGRKYYMHLVEKGQSLYAIAKIYNLDLNTILIDNPDAIDGINQGQELKIPFAKETPVVNNTTKDFDQYETHKVVKGETMYGITKKYNVTEKELNDLNPELKSGIKEGQTLKIFKKKTIVFQPINVINPDVLYNWHTVEQSETSYSISKKYNITLEQLAKLNPEISTGLKLGQKLKINLKTEVLLQNITSDTVAIDTNLVFQPKKKTYRIGIFFPFRLNELDLFSVDELVIKKLNFPQVQQITIDLLEGIKQAADSLQDKDFKLEFVYVDTGEKDSISAEKPCNEQLIKSLDLIIGPLYTSYFKNVSQCAAKLQVPIVSPLSTQNKILFENPLASKTTCSNSTLIEALAEFVADSFRTHNIVILNTGSFKDQGSIKIFKNKYAELMLAKYNNTTDTVMEAKFIQGAKNAYNPNKKNYYILLSENEVIVSDMMTSLSQFIGEKKEITLIGMKKWIALDNLDPEYFNRFSLLYAAPSFINFADSRVKLRTIDYRKKYVTDPDEYFFTGYDLGIYYFSLLKETGPAFIASLDQAKRKGLTMGFDFYRPSNKTGFENKSIQIIRYKDYKFQKAN